MPYKLLDHNNTCYDHLCKIILVGDTAVGKSSFLVRFSDGVFENSNISTIGIDFKIKSIKLDNKIIKLQILDTAGQERFRSIITSHFRNAMGVILMYDITNYESFSNIQMWKQMIEKYSGNNKAYVLVGNKSDLKSKRMIEYEKGENLAKELGVPFFETSAKSDSMIEAVFEKIANNVLEEISRKEEPDERVSLLNRKKENRNNCCPIN